MISAEEFHRLRLRLDRAGVQLVAVSKTVPPDRILRLYEWGQRDFGENRPQELRDKRPQLPNDIRWHMIGRLQTNKVKYVVGTTALVHSADRPKVLEVLNQRAHRMGIRQPVLLQVRIAQEDTKAGMPPDEVRRFFDEGGPQRYPNLTIRGLMGMATHTDDFRIVRQEFRTLRRLFEEVRQGMPHFEVLSMGMTHDYEVAVDEGATMVRIGSLIFGPRA